MPDSDTILQFFLRILHSPRLRQSSQFQNFIFPTKNDSLLEKDKPLKYALEDFQLLRVVGKGCMGKVFLVRLQASQDLLALKVISKRRLCKPKEQIHVKKERDILALISEIHHPFLVHLKCTFQDTENLYIAMEYHAGGDIATELMRLGVFEESRILFCAAEITCGIKELHRLGIVYRYFCTILTLQGLEARKHSDSKEWPSCANRFRTIQAVCWKRCQNKYFLWYSRISSTRSTHW